MKNKIFNFILLKTFLSQVFNLMFTTKSFNLGSTNWWIFEQWKPTLESSKDIIALLYWIMNEFLSSVKSIFGHFSLNQCQYMQDRTLKLNRMVSLIQFVMSQIRKQWSLGSRAKVDGHELNFEMTWGRSFDLRLGSFWCPGVYGFYLSESARGADSDHIS